MIGVSCRTHLIVLDIESHSTFIRGKMRVQVDFMVTCIRKYNVSHSG